MMTTWEEIAAMIVVIKAIGGASLFAWRWIKKRLTDARRT